MANMRSASANVSRGTCFGAHEPDAAVRACQIARGMSAAGPGGNASALPVHKAIQVAQARPRAIAAMFEAPTGAPLLLERTFFVHDGTSRRPTRSAALGG